MISATNYTAITGAAAPANFTALESFVVSRLEAALDRNLNSTLRTEWLPVYSDGVVYPRALPVTDALGNEFDPISISTGVRGNGNTIEVQYVGGFTAYGSSEGVACPLDLAQAIAWGVHTLANPQPGVIGAGVTSLNIAGEWSITKAPDAVLGADGLALPPHMADLADLGGRCAVLAARYRRLA